MNVVVLEDAKQDIIDGYWFYEFQKDGLGNYFLDSIYADIDSLLFYAGIHEKVQGFHRLLSKTFPFAVYYYVDVEVVNVYAVLDCRIDPSRLSRRLNQ